jgi:glycosyltransferase involved in cell wall biosynthesis
VTSIVIAAHNEAGVIGGTLDTLMSGVRPGELDVTVVANGCTDETAAEARRRGARVLEVARPGKANALNEGDAVAVGFPRIYLDADIPVGVQVVRTLSELLEAPDSTALVAFPARRLDLTGRPVVVKAYFAVHGRLPAFREGLFGRGMIAVSERGRARFDAFPDLVADDLFLDSLFRGAEKRLVEDVHTTVATPYTSRDLVRRLVRVRRGNSALRAAGEVAQAVGGEVRPSDRWSWLRDVVVPRPWLAPAAAVYVAVTLAAAVLARRSGAGATWGRDESTRGRATPGSVPDGVGPRRLPPPAGTEQPDERRSRESTPEG